MLRRLDTGILGGTQPVTGISGDVHSTGTQDVSALGESFDQTPLVVPVRGHLDSIKRLLKGDVYIGRGSRQRSLHKSRYCNTFKVSQVGRSVAISSFRQALLADPALYNSLWTLSGTRLVCHCRASEDCHGDVLVEEFRKLYPAAHDRNLPWVLHLGMAARAGISMTRKAGDRVDIPIDYRFLDVLLRASGDPETGLGDYAQGVRVGPGTRMPRLPALYKAKKKWRLHRSIHSITWSTHLTVLEFGGATIRLFANSRRKYWTSCMIKLRGARS